MSRARWAITPGSATGQSPDRVNYSLVGHGPNLDPSHGAQRFGTHEEATGYMAKHGLQHYTGKPRTHLGDDPSRP